MMYFYFLIISGVFFVFFGALKLITIFERMHRQLSQFEELAETTNYADLQALRHELDELNFSYYEILSDLSDRLEIAEKKIEDILTVESMPARTELVNKNIPRDSIELHSDVITTKPIEDERMRVIRLIDQGFNDADIAKILQIGTGKVALLRKLDEHKK